MRKFISAIALSLASAFTAYAGINDVKFLQPGMPQVLEDGVRYGIPFESLTIDMHDKVFMSPLSVEVGKIGLLELRNGQRIIVTGSDGMKNAWSYNTRRMGYPGILVPEGAALIVYGDGEIIAKGGAGGRGSVGEPGGNGDIVGATVIGGYGGGGGFGGGGGAPGIGAIGGIGGKGALRTKTYEKKVSMSTSYDDINPGPGLDGYDGEKGKSMGEVYILGNVKVVASAGQPGSFVHEFSSHGAGLNYYESGASNRFFRVGYGGAGGSGGSGAAAKYDIGGGAPGAGGGGSGGIGGFMSDMQRDDLRYISGGGGKGGNALEEKYSGRNGEGIPSNDKGIGGKGGNSSTEYGANGKLFKTGSVIINGKYETESVKEITSLEMLPEKIRPLLTRIIKGAEWGKDKTSLETFVGQCISDTHVNVPVDATKGAFMGYYDQYGKLVYDEKGDLNPDIKDHSVNFSVVENKIGEVTNYLWYVNAIDTIQLHAVWSGAKSIFVLRYLENPDFDGYPTDPKRYTTGELIAEHIYVPANQTSVQIDVYPDQQIDNTLFKYTGEEQEKILVSLEKADNLIVVNMNYDGMKYRLSYEDTDVIQRHCTNTGDYTPAGSYQFERALILPRLSQRDGKSFSHWERKLADGKYEVFDTDKMIAEDLTLRPVFENASFSACTEVIGQGSVKLHLNNGQDVTSESPLGYHDRVIVEPIVSDAAYRCKRITVIGKNSDREIIMDEATSAFLMPDEDVKVCVEFEYHPYSKLKVELVEDMGMTDDIRLYVTKDWNTYYTDDNDYYQFDESKVTGGIVDLQFSSGDRLYLVSDYAGDDGSRQASLSYTRMEDSGEHLVDIKRTVTGFADSTMTYFAFTVDSLMTKSDLLLTLSWSDSRSGIRVKFVESKTAQFTDLYSGMHDVGNDNTAYAGDQITFKVKTEDSEFDTSNIEAEYSVVDETKRISVISAGNGIFAFTMPDENLTLRLIEGTKHGITTDDSNTDKAYIMAPSSGIVGAQIYGSIIINKEQVDFPNQDDLVLYVNGLPHDVYSVPSNTDEDAVVVNWNFIMPDENVFLSLNEDYYTGISTIDDDDRRLTHDVYNLMGQKIGSLRNGKLKTMPSGIVIVDGKKVRFIEGL